MTCNWLGLMVGHIPNRDFVLYSLNKFRRMNMFLTVELTAVERKKVTTLCNWYKTSGINDIVQTSYVLFFEVSADVAEI